MTEKRRKEKSLEQNKQMKSMKTVVAVVSHAFYAYLIRFHSLTACRRNKRTNMQHHFDTSKHPTEECYVRFPIDAMGARVRIYALNGSEAKNLVFGSARTRSHRTIELNPNGKKRGRER